MKTVPYRRTRGNVKMKGLKHCGLSCRCCTISNTKEKVLEEQADKEARQEFWQKTAFLDTLKYMDLRSDQDEMFNTSAAYYDMYVESMPL